MKKMILAVVAVAVVGMNAQSARAGDREWATVGKVLTGVAAGVVIARAIDCEPSYVSASYGSYGCSSGYSVSYTVSAPPPCPPPRVVCAPPVYYAPAPVVYQPVYCAPRPVVYYTPAPVYHASYGWSSRGHGNGHGYGYGNGRWSR